MLGKRKYFTEKKNDGIFTLFMVISTCKLKLNLLTKKNTFRKTIIIRNAVINVALIYYNRQYTCCLQVFLAEISLQSIRRKLVKIDNEKCYYNKLFLLFVSV